MARASRRRRADVVVEVFTRAPCGLCRAAEQIVAAEAGGTRVELVDIDASDELVRRYGLRVPVVVVDGEEVAEGRVEPGSVRRAIRRARGGPIPWPRR